MKIKSRHLTVALFCPVFLVYLTGCVTQQVETRKVTDTVSMKYEETVHVETDPTGAKVYFKDEYIGLSPCDVILKAGNVLVSGTGTVNYNVSVNGMSGQRFEAVDSTSWHMIGSLQPSAPSGSWTIQASKAGYDPAARLIQISSDDDELNAAFQGVDAISKFNTAIQNKLNIGAMVSARQQIDQSGGLASTMMAPVAQQMDNQINSTDDSTLPVVSGHRSVLLTLSPAAAQQQQQQQQQQQTVVVPGGGDSSASKRGLILVSSEPESADVYADGVFVGNAPANLKLDEGIHIIEVKMDGYKPYRKELRVLADSELSLKAQLDKDSPNSVPAQP
jgi:hypothetical protein